MTIQELDDQFGYLLSNQVASPESQLAEHALLNGVRKMYHLLWENPSAVVSRLTDIAVLQRRPSLIVVQEPAGRGRISQAEKWIKRLQWKVIQPAHTLVWQACDIQHITYAENDTVAWFRSQAVQEPPVWWSFEATDTRQNWRAEQSSMKFDPRPGSLFRPTQPL